MTVFTHIREHVNSKGQIVPISEIEKFIKNPSSDYYSNLYSFDSNVIEYFNKNDNSIKGYEGLAFTNKLVFDLDSKDNIEIAKEDAQSLLYILQELGVNIKDSTAVYFSGRKGFHVEVLTNQQYSPEELKNICKFLAGDKTSFDDAIYSLVRAFRLVNTKHNISGLYKVSISEEELLNNNAEEIKDLATKPRLVKQLIPTNVDFKQFNKVAPKAKSVIVSSEHDSESIRGLGTIDYKQCPKGTPRCYFAMSKGAIEPGTRSRMFFMLAKFYRNQGFEREVTHRLLKGVAELNNQLYPEAELITKEEIWDQHVAAAYSSSSVKHQNPKGTGTSSDNELLLKYCNAIKSDCKCTLHKATNSMMKIEDVSDVYEAYAVDLDKNLVKTGIEFIDSNMQITTGTVNLLVGSAGSGKTSLAMNILQKSTEIDQHSIFFSMDMHKTLVYQKLAQKVSGYNSKQIQQFYQDRNKKKIEEIKESIANKFGKTYFDFTSCLTLDEMRDRIKMAEDKMGSKMKLVIVDYAGRISGPYSDTYANAKYNALRTTGVADETNAAWIILSQISRQVGDSNTPLRTKRAAKDSSDWEEVASNLLTIWRPYAGMGEKDGIMRIFLAKSRMGQEKEGLLHWDGAKGEIWDMSPEQLEYYEMNHQHEEDQLRKIRTGK